MAKGQTQDFPGIPGQYFRTCELCLAKAYPRLLLTKTMWRHTWIQIDWFWNQICPIFVLKICNYIFEKYICLNVRITSGRGRGRFHKILVQESFPTKFSAHDKNHPANVKIWFSTFWGRIRTRARWILQNAIKMLMQGCITTKCSAHQKEQSSKCKTMFFWSFWV